MAEYYSFVTKLIKENNVLRGVEVGTWQGNLSSYVLETCLDLTWISIDAWKYFGLEYKDGTNISQDKMEMVYASVKQKLLKFGSKSIIKRSLSLGAAKHIEDLSLDMVFIDANHTHKAVKEDIYAWWPKVKDNGIISGHDIHHPPVEQAVREAFGINFSANKKARIWYLKKQGQLL